MRKFLLILISIFLFNCSNNKINSFNTELENIDKIFAPDKSIAVFDVNLEKSGGYWILRGETTSKKAKKVILKTTKSIIGNSDFLDSLFVLPHPELQADTIAIAKKSVVNLRGERGVSKELVDQVILGDKLRILKKDGWWYLVQTEYGYLGWITRYSVEILPKDSEWFINKQRI